MWRILVAGPLVALVACNNDTSVIKSNPTLDLEPDLLDVGATLVGTPVTGFFTVSDVGAAEAHITDVSVVNDDGAQFEWDGVIPEVIRHGTADIGIVYAPTEEGYHTATVTITYDNPIEPDLVGVVRGQAGQPAAHVYPWVLDFGDVAAGDHRSLELTIVNDGLVDLTLDAAGFSSDSFALAEGLPLQVEAASETVVAVVYEAADTSPREESLTLGFGGLELAPVTLKANDCAHGNPSAYDLDEDGYTTCGGDCDDDAEDTNPAGRETADGTDEDCDGTTDEGTVNYDDDGDGWTEVDGDCNDAEQTVNPGQTEIGDNGIDDDCNGAVDGGSFDADHDGYADAGGDCDDGDAGRHPGAEELPNGLDDDCDGAVDEGTTSFDDDGDGQTEAGGDCDDENEDAWRGAPELPDYLDNDCDGTIDEGTDNGDDDGDGFTENGGDCDDGNAAVNPAASEVARNGIDDDCDGTTS